MGSRFFTVANGGSAMTAAQVWPASLAVSASPRRIVRIAEGERTELQLPRGAPHVARQVVNGTTRALPAGSTFDAAEAKFYWQPAAGFLGAYDLEFNADSRGEKVRLVVGPSIRMAIDTPRAGNVLSASGFTLAGWAVDLAARDGAGIDTLHVWAYPVAGGDPVFVGATSGGGRRPEVASLYGSVFEGAGYTVSGRLSPGTYDVVVYARSAASKSFAGAETERVVVR
jgi:hypothetical protein